MTENKDTRYDMTSDEYEEMLAEWGERTTTIKADLNAKFEKLKLTINPYFNPEFDAVCKAIKNNDTRIKFLTLALKNAHITDAPEKPAEEDDEEEKAEHIRRIGRLIRSCVLVKLRNEVAESAAEAEKLAKTMREAKPKAKPQPKPEDEYPNLIPYRERAYDWAYREMKDLFENPKTIRLTASDPFSMSSACHVSLFHVDDPKKPVILRQYWVRSNYILFRIVKNYEELYRFHPEIVDILIANGVTEYESALKRMYSDADKNGLLVIPDPLYPYRLPDD